MPDSIQMEIAGVNFNVASRQTIARREPDPSYRPFLHKSYEGPGAVAISILLEAGNMPDTTGLARVFDSGESWSMFSEGSDRLLALNPSPPGSQPIWVARVNPEFTRATVHCGDKLAATSNGRTVISNPVSYPMDQILLMHILARKRGIILHAAAAGIRGRAFVFPGKSGAGKSTLARHLARRGGMDVLSDDRVVVREIGGCLKVFGSPWPGDAGAAANGSFPLSGIFFIRHAAASSINALKPGETLERLLPVVSIPWYDREACADILSFCEKVIGSVPAFEFNAAAGIEAASFLDGFLQCRENDIWPRSQ